MWGLIPHRPLSAEPSRHFRQSIKPAVRLKSRRLDALIFLSHHHHPCLTRTPQPKASWIWSETSQTTRATSTPKSSKSIYQNHATPHHHPLRRSRTHGVCHRCAGANQCRTHHGSASARPLQSRRLIMESFPQRLSTESSRSSPTQERRKEGPSSRAKKGSVGKQRLDGLDWQVLWREAVQQGWKQCREQSWGQLWSPLLVVGKGER